MCSSLQSDAIQTINKLNTLFIINKKHITCAERRQSKQRQSEYFITSCRSQQRHWYNLKSEHFNTGGKKIIIDILSLV